MKINFLSLADLKSLKKSTLVLAISEEVVKNSSNDLIKKARELYEFKGKTSQICSVPGPNGLVIIAGIGNENKFDDLAAQKLGGRILSYVNGIKLNDVVVIFGCELDSKNNLKNKVKSSAEITANIAFGANLQSYRFNKYFNAKKRRKRC
jgi:leucyl aminopeptidase